MKLYKSKKDNELFYYFNAKKEKHRYYDKNNKRKEKSRQGFKTENEAYRALLEVKTGIISGETKKVENSNLTVAEWLDTWFDSYKNQWKITT